MAQFSKLRRSSNISYEWIYIFDLHCSYIDSLKKKIWFFTIFAYAIFIVLIRNSDFLRITQQQLKSWLASLLP